MLVCVALGMEGAATEGAGMFDYLREREEKSGGGES